MAIVPRVCPHTAASALFSGSNTTNPRSKRQAMSAMRQVEDFGLSVDAALSCGDLPIEEVPAQDRPTDPVPNLGRGVA